MRKRFSLMLTLALTVCLLCGCAYLPLSGMENMLPGKNEAQVTDNGDTVTISKEQYEKYQQFDKLLEIMGIVGDNYYQDVETDDLLEGAAQGLLYGVGDPYTFYYTAEDFAEMWEEDEGEYAGIGIQISASYLTNICTVSRVFDNGPAHEAGVLKGDILYKVEDMYVDAYNLQEAVDIMRGIPGTDVNVVFLRGGEELSFTLTRAKISVNRVESTMLEDGIGYIYLYDFAGDCAVKFEAALNDLVDRGAKGIIIDLRDNPGGWTADAESIADLFMDKGVIYYLEYRDGQREYAYSKNGKTDVQLVVLMNQYSASSSEILCGALKDRADATVVGVQSYGKGIVQAVVGLSDQSGMQVTIAQYFTPNGNKVHQVGITPDVEVQLPEGDIGMYQFGDLSDPQLSRALEIMQEKLAK